MLLEEDPHTLIASIHESFSIESDTSQITRVSDQLHHLRQAREKQRDEQQHLLRLLTRKLDVTRQSYDESAAEHALAGHNQAILALDRKKFALAKSVNDLESAAHALEGQLARLREELDTLDAEDPLARAVADGDEAGTTYAPPPRARTPRLTAAEQAQAARVPQPGHRAAGGRRGRVRQGGRAQPGQGRLPRRQHRGQVYAVLLRKLLLGLAVGAGAFGGAGGARGGWGVMGRVRRPATTSVFVALPSPVLQTGSAVMNTPGSISRRFGGAEVNGNNRRVFITRGPQCESPDNLRTYESQAWRRHR